MLLGGGLGPASWNVFLWVRVSLPLCLLGAFQLDLGQVTVAMKLWAWVCKVLLSLSPPLLIVDQSEAELAS